MNKVSKSKEKISKFFERSTTLTLSLPSHNTISLFVNVFVESKYLTLEIKIQCIGLLMERSNCR